MTKVNQVQQLRDKISEVHNMQERYAQQWEACGVHGVDQCTICGLTHHWYRHGQNSPDDDQYEDGYGHKLTLADAARKECD
jgi:hypothetical protein